MFGKEKRELPRPLFCTPMHLLNLCLGLHSVGRDADLAKLAIAVWVVSALSGRVSIVLTTVHGPKKFSP